MPLHGAENITLRQLGDAHCRGTCKPLLSSLGLQELEAKLLGDSAENCAAPGLCWITCLLPIMNLLEIPIHCSDINCYKIWLVSRLGLSGFFTFGA